MSANQVFEQFRENRRVGLIARYFAKDLVLIRQLVVENPCFSSRSRIRSQRSVISSEEICMERSRRSLLICRHEVGLRRASTSSQTSRVIGGSASRLLLASRRLSTLCNFFSPIAVNVMACAARRAVLHESEIRRRSKIRSALFEAEGGSARLDLFLGSTAEHDVSHAADRDGKDRAFWQALELTERGRGGALQ